ncbi:hypothetical protein [Actinoplanes sp. GCM10030250]|uniref:hypothetical protein n=1 Tax=Actinoplanes sp. GCM10030250 TaxID=3273376 RepID=UPI003615A75F
MAGKRVVLLVADGQFGPPLHAATIRVAAHRKLHAVSPQWQREYDDALEHLVWLSNVTGDWQTGSTATAELIDLRAELADS